MIPRPGAYREGIGGREERSLIAVATRGQTRFPTGPESSIAACLVNRNLVNDNGAPFPGFFVSVDSGGV